MDELDVRNMNVAESPPSALWRVTSDDRVVIVDKFYKVKNMMELYEVTSVEVAVPVWARVV